MERAGSLGEVVLREREARHMKKILFLALAVGLSVGTFYGVPAECLWCEPNECWHDYDCQVGCVCHISDLDFGEGVCISEN